MAEMTGILLESLSVSGALLLKVSGVTLLEADIAGRRPAYVDYVRRTNAFIPGPRKAPVEDGAGRINGGHA